MLNESMFPNSSMNGTTVIPAEFVGRVANKLHQHNSKKSSSDLQNTKHTSMRHLTALLHVF